MNRERESAKLRKWEFSGIWEKKAGSFGRRALPALLVPASSRRLGDNTGTPGPHPAQHSDLERRGVGVPGQVPINHPSLALGDRF